MMVPDGEVDNNVFEQWQAAKNAAILCKHSGDIHAAISHTIQATKFLENVPALSKNRVSLLNFLADLYLQEHILDKAEEAVLNAITASKASGDAYLADNLLMFADVLYKQGRIREALHQAQLSERHYCDTGNEHGRTRAANMIKTIELKDGFSHQQ